ncbi:MAG: hypothetical protein RLZZ293_115 [Pseudomonadota bacterium]|jgi:dihydrofolate reductase
MNTTQKISLVVAMNKQRVIGVNNQLPWHLPEDLAYFKQVTLGKPIIMGRKTFQSIGRILPNRPNIVISRSDFKYSGIEIYPSLIQALEHYQDSPEICIIGGGEIFAQSIHLANIIHLTIVDYPVDNPCAWFPEFDLTKWKIIDQQAKLSQTGITFTIYHYQRVA